MRAFAVTVGPEQDCRIAISRRSVSGYTTDCTVPAHDDFRECRAKDTLARSGGCSGMRPGALQIST
jgi:hypothetical protein